MKAIIKILLLLSLAFFTWSYITYPEVGRMAFAVGSTLEEKLYALHEEHEEVDGFQYAYLTNQTEKDNRPAIIFLHGYTADKDVWPRFARHFTDDYRVLIPDMAGHGKTGFQKDANYSVAKQADRIIEFMQTLNVSSAHIIGNSMGGFIAADIAIRFPEKTASVALIDPAGVDSPIKSDVLKMYELGRNPFMVNSDEEFESFYALTMKQPPWLPGFVLDAISQRYQQHREEYAVIFDDFFNNKKITEYEGKVKSPSLLLFGKEDQIIHVSSTAVWERVIPGIETVKLDGIGHMPMVESPTNSAKIYQKFLNSVIAEKKR